jgi:hypothetical protein
MAAQRHVTNSTIGRERAAPVRVQAHQKDRHTTRRDSRKGLASPLIHV